MGIFSFFSYTSDVKVETASEFERVALKPTTVVISEPDGVQPSSAKSTLPTNGSTAGPSQTTNKVVSDTRNEVKILDASIFESEQVEEVRRFSFRPFGFVRKPAEHKPALSAAEDHQKREHAAKASERRASKVSKSDKRAKKSALLVRSLIIGPVSATPKVTRVVAKPQLNKIKSQLMETKSANKLIAQLRELPSNGETSLTERRNGPIHAACLEHTDEEEDCLHFSKLTPLDVASPEDAAVQGIVSAPVDKLAELFQEMRVIDLIKAPDFGLGQPGDGEGLLAGALPTARTVLDGVKQITPELMALGYATGRAFVPNHTGIYPPTDRMSVLTYWWGLEVLLPPPSLSYLSNVQSITGTVMNFLSAISLVNNGVREILPFIRYIAQFIDFEFNAIKRQDQGQGVVCAATWIMPAALVPRPWDFPTPPPVNVPTDPTEDKGKPEAPKLPPGTGGIILPPGPLPGPLPPIVPVDTYSLVKSAPTNTSA